WIWDDDERHPRNAWRLFRHVFDAETTIGATLTITADTRYEAYVNGILVGRGPVRGFPDRWMVDTWSIESHLRVDQPNSIAVLVVHPGIPMFLDLGNQAGLLAQIDGVGSAPIVTDPTWRVIDPPGQDPRSNRMSCQLGFSEFIDAREFPVGWQSPTFDASDWPAATEIAAPGEAPWPNLVLRDIPPLQEAPVRPTHVERLAWVRPFPIAEVVDLRNQFDPSTLHHANHTAYSGYLVTLIRLAEADTVTVAMPWSRFQGMGIDGAWHDLNTVTHGPGSQKSISHSLAAGDHWLVIDVSRVDHGDGFQVAVDGTIPGNVTIASPLGNGQETAWVTIGSFTIVDPEPVFPPVHPIPAEVVTVAQSLKDRAALEAIGEVVQPVPARYVSPLDLFTLATQPRERTEAPVPAELQAIAAGNVATLPDQTGFDSELIFDLGREFSGFIAFDVEAPAGVILDWYGFEYLRGDHRENTERLDNSFRYVTRAGRQQYGSPTRRGMRFLQLNVRRPGGVTGEVRLHDLTVTESHFPVSRVGRFRCSNARLEQIHELARRTVIACMEDTYVDCPAYEQTYWVGDAYNSARFATYLFGAEALTERCVRLVPASVMQTPYFASQVPSGWVSVIPNWTFFWTMMTHHHWYRTGDDAFATELWPVVKVALDHFREHINSDGLLEISAWNLLDWAPIDQPNHGIVTHQNMLMVVALDQGAVLAAVAGDDDGASQYRAAADALRTAINRHLWSETDGGYIDCIHADGRRSTTLSIHSQMLALLADVPTGARAERCGAVLVNPPDGWVRIGSPWMSAFLYDVLGMLGRADDALADILLNYGMMLDHDATTCWEVYPTSNINDGSQLSRSHCHAWSAAPGAFLPAWVLGVRPTAPGWHGVLVAPNPCGLEWAEGSVPLPSAGRVDVSWRIGVEGTFRLEVSAPDGINVQARLPEGYSGTVTVNGVSSQV
ncbi:MAG TPA: family 78 glycoside hydrolase catalytic domain, partial [Thermomicrobiales bacterium]|nr:family 78 glycoside hydrolase catalytic domain [Thermomicrobiales bacterium]